MRREVGMNLLSSSGGEASTDWQRHGLMKCVTAAECMVSFQVGMNLRSSSAGEAPIGWQRHGFNVWQLLNCSIHLERWGRACGCSRKAGHSHC